MYPIVVLALVNFAVFFVVAVMLDGDAINGHVQSGHYYLMSHGHYTEVSAAVWHYSYWHTISVFVTHGLVFVTWIVLSITKQVTGDR
jgi:hypothetical protein